MGIQFTNVSFSYNKKEKKYVLKNINLKINPKNEFIALLGKVGSGKSTLVQLMNNLLLPSKGYIDLFGKRINYKTSNKELFLLKRKIGLVFQFPEYQLFETTVLKDVMFAPKNFNKSNLESEKIAIESLIKVGISKEFFNISPFKLSGGQQRKVAIAGVLSMEPSILILDEPTRGLDSKSQIEIMNILKKQNKNEKKTIIFITHNIDLVAKYASKVLLLDKGEIIFYGKKDYFFMPKIMNQCNFSSEPQSFKILNFLNKKIGIKFELKYDFKQLLNYLIENEKGKK
ncbi:ABC transporter family protein [Candidatus Phytoplasma oryzae]|uniref:ABC transporter family protein n=1 Tax=Candidatus Phytoplasma oryzae TaxID=203274 RepID=A0A139JQ94_9MOLU|nr:ATP-binding cassette domain-containing protein [Candidatus Phytoplasma oryzae]KXT29135.1 ABC transporter family protein [Candidatus Phytoplasma oryzae]